MCLWLCSCGMVLARHARTGHHRHLHFIVLFPRNGRWMLLLGSSTPSLICFRFHYFFFCFFSTIFPLFMMFFITMPKAQLNRIPETKRKESWKTFVWPFIRFSVFRFSRVYYEIRWAWQPVRKLGIGLSLLRRLLCSSTHWAHDHYACNGEQLQMNSNRFLFLEPK